MSPERLTFFCPACWAKVAESSPTCSRCGTDMEGVQAQRDFVDKLIAALDHPEPETRARAAMIQGWRGEKRGVDPLLHVALREDDAYLVETAVEALGRIGDPRCGPALQAVACRGPSRVLRAALRALVSLETSREDSNE